MLNTSFSTISKIHRHIQYFIRTKIIPAILKFFLILVYFVVLGPMALLFRIFGVKKRFTPGWILSPENDDVMSLKRLS